MKHTLKNRPRIHWKETLREFGYDMSEADETEAWFEGLARELREHRKSLRVAIRKQKEIHDQTGVLVAEGIFRFVEELLGEGASSPYVPLGHEWNSCKCSQCQLKRTWELNRGITMKRELLGEEL